MENTLGPRLEALCCLCISALYQVPREQRLVRGSFVEKDMEAYPSKIIAGVLAGTHTVEILDHLGRGDGHQLTFKAVTVFQGSDLCATHVTKMNPMGAQPYYPREYHNR